MTDSPYHRLIRQLAQHLIDNPDNDPPFRMTVEDRRHLLKLHAALLSGPVNHPHLQCPNCGCTDQIFISIAVHEPAGVVLSCTRCKHRDAGSPTTDLERQAFYKDWLPKNPESDQ